MWILYENPIGMSSLNIVIYVPVLFENWHPIPPIGIGERSESCQLLETTYFSKSVKYIFG